MVEGFDRRAPTIREIGFRVKGTIPFAQAIVSLLFRNAKHPPRGEIPNSPFSASVLPFCQHLDPSTRIPPSGLRCAHGDRDVTGTRFDGEFADEHRDYV